MLFLEKEKEMEINTEIGAKDLDLSKSEWIQNIIELWRKCEELIKNEKILSVGVADLHLAPLKSIYECGSSLKPCLDHFNIEGCCVVRFFLVDNGIFPNIKHIQKC